MKLIVGLGNPGKKYQMTKHNIGFMVLDAFAKTRNESFKKDKKFNGESLKIADTIFLKPHTFMNLSGQSVQSAMKFYDIELDDILIIYDDLALPLGKLRIREQGSSGGHNGIKSIINHVQSETFKRVRIGIDSNELIDTKDYVLSKFSKNEMKTIEESIEKTVSLVEDFMKDTSFSTIMNKYN